jgi:glycosyltransferase involved in cell wall biosynthesis
MKTNVGFIINFNPSKWLGGFNYIKNLIFFLGKFKIKNINPVIITNNKNYFKKEYKLGKIDILETNIVSNNNFFIRVLGKMLIIIFGKNYFLEKFLTKNKIQAISHFEYTGKNSRVKSFVWFPDFQEIHFPKYFSLKSRLLRKFNLWMAATHSTKILISSNSVLDDIKKINKKAFRKSILIKHAINLPKIKIKKDLHKKFGIKKKYFIVPNTYWMHKNHFVLLKAINFLKKNKKEINFQIVSTGYFFDHRNPQYVLSIKNYLESNKLINDFLILNIVPLGDLINLINNSIALINPSKSEGWSNSVEQGMALNKKIIVSKIKIHKEQNENNKFIFFSQNNYKQLAKILDKEYKKVKVIKNTCQPSITQNYQKKQKGFIENFEKLIIKNTY